MNFMQTVVQALGNSSKVSVRIAGRFSRQGRYLAVLTSTPDGKQVVNQMTIDSIGMGEFSTTTNPEGTHEVFFGRRSIAVFATAEEANLLVEKIFNAIAPSKWRIARRLAALWLAIAIIVPSQVPVRQTMSAPSVAASEFRGASPYVAPRAASVPVADGAAIAAPTAVDPFGLPVGGK